MTTYNTPLLLAQKLVALPSYVDGTQDEIPALDFLVDYLTETFPEMTLQKQYLEGSPRYNILLTGKSKPKLFVLGHIDTVQPKEGWQTNPLIPVIKDGNLYGLGAADMKSSLAAFLWALAQKKPSTSLDDLAILIYVDEEYDFKGIKRFLADRYAETITPELTLSLDGSLAVATGCRGLVEVALTIKGKSGHASNPNNGVNAITESMAALSEVGKELAAFVDADLGPTTINVAAIRGGVTQQNADDTIRWLEEGNIIPDTARITLEVRPSVPQVDAKFVTKTVKKLVEQRGLVLVEAAVRHDIVPWPVRYDSSVLSLLQNAYMTAGTSFEKSDRKLQGYIDAHMVADEIKAPTFIVGTGGNNKHGANENVPLQNIEAAARIYRALLREMLS